MPDPVQEQELFKWSAPERPYKPVSNQFFTTAIAIVVLISIVLALSGEWMLIAVLASMIFVYYVWTKVPPGEVEYSLTTLGVRVGSQLYKWEDCTRFWFQDELLLIDTPISFPRRLHLIADKNAVSEILRKYVLEEKPQETPVERATAWISQKFPLEAK